MKKNDSLKRWKDLPSGLNPLKEMLPIPYKAEGSRYGACGIRIDGTPDFIDAVLSNLKPLIDGENQVTRLELARSQVKSTNIRGETRAFANAVNEAEVCYIRLHMRGAEGAISAGIFDRHLDGATVRYVEQIEA